MITITCEDCFELMKRYPDKYFDLAVVDPPYGIGKDWKKRRNGRKGKDRFVNTSYKNDSIPEKAYFDELMRVSHHQIIWGYNYFTDILGPTNYLLVWDKCSNNVRFNYSQAEIAFTSFRQPMQIIQVPWDGCRMGRETGIKKIHPHQKPVELYIKILRKYAKPGFKILDTHMGSGSSVIACHRLGLDIDACEIDQEFFLSAKRRLVDEVRQQELFSIKERQIPENLLFEDLKEAL